MCHDFSIGAGCCMVDFDTSLVEIRSPSTVPLELVVDLSVDSLPALALGSSSTQEFRPTLLA